MKRNCTRRRQLGHVQQYINLRRSRDGGVRSCVHVEFGLIQLTLGSFYAVHISVLRKEENACSINTIPYDSVINSDFIHVYFC